MSLNALSREIGRTKGRAERPFLLSLIDQAERQGGKMKHKLGFLFFRFIQGRSLYERFTSSRALAEALHAKGLINLYEEKDDKLNETHTLSRASWFSFKGREMTYEEMEKIFQADRPKGKKMKRFIFFALIFASLTGHAHGQEDRLRAAGWFDSHHEAYEFGPQRPINDYNYQAVEVYRDLAVEQIRANPQQRIPQGQQQGTRCLRTLYGVHCQ
jgi:hypothetical protein